MIPTTRIECLSFDEENDEYIKLTSDSTDHVSIKLVADELDRTIAVILGEI